MNELCWPSAGSVPVPHITFPRGRSSAPALHWQKFRRASVLLTDFVRLCSTSTRYRPMFFVRVLVLGAAGDLTTACYAIACRALPDKFDIMGGENSTRPFGVVIMLPLRTRSVQ